MTVVCRRKQERLNEWWLLVCLCVLGDNDGDYCENSLGILEGVLENDLGGTGESGAVFHASFSMLSS